MAGSGTKKKTGTKAGTAAKKSTKSTPKSTAKSTSKSTPKNITKEAELDSGFLQSEIVVLGTFAVCVFLFLSNFHICGALGTILSNIMLGVFGSIGYLAPVLLFIGMIFYASNQGNIRAVYKMLAVEILLLTLCALAQMLFGGGYQEGQTLKEIYQAAGETGLGGGVIGGAIVWALHSALGTIGTYLVLILGIIISMVCITEKSFVSFVKKESDKAYQYAKDDYDRRKVIREERKEEKRLLREEQRVKGVNLNSTDLSKTGEEVFEPYTKLELVPEEAGDREMVIQEAVHGQEQEVQAVREADEPMQVKAERKKGGKLPSANEFHGKISMPQTEPELKPESGAVGMDSAREAETETEIQDEPKTSPVPPVVPYSRQKDEDVFVTRDSQMFREMGLFPEWESRGREERKPVDISADKMSVSASAAAFVPVDAMEPADCPTANMTETVRIEEEDAFLTEPYVENEEYWESIEAVRVQEQEPQEEQERYMEEERAETGIFQMPDEPLEEPESADDAGLPVESAMLYAPDKPKQVVTSSGKVIDTDAEEIMRKKMEQRRMDAAEQKEAEEHVLKEIQKREEAPKKPYLFPPIDLLKRGNGPAVGQSEQEYRDTAIKLQQTLRNFGVGVTVTNISCGPTVTRYELQPEQGVKVSRIQSLADDIKLNLAATDIRIEAPIPGKAAVGIEVPNKVNSIVYLRGLLESKEFQNHSSRLAFAVGKDIGGQTIVADLAKMPHLLIAGQTGSGKSVGINTMIMSLIYRSSPEDVKLIMIDPKVVELSIYNGIPHLLIPVVTDPKKAAGALNWAVAEMMERYNKFASSNVRDIKGYNARVQSLMDAGDVPEDQIPAKLPQLVIIIDELADLMMVASGEVEDAICRLAQLARAAGIHLVIATQRPSVNVITGVIKANVPSRIAFSVASGVDSRTILDMHGAEKLLGNGDMLFYPSGYPKPIRVQGAFVSDSEVSAVTDFIKAQNEGRGYNTELEKKMSQSSAGGMSGGGSDRDALFMDAGRFIIEKEKASIGMLQRVFKIGFNRAARIMDQLAEAGVVGEEEGTKPRKILMSMEQFEDFLDAGY